LRSPPFALVLFFILLPAACAHRPLAVVLSFNACPAGDGSVNVAANVASDVAPAVRELARDRFPGACAVELAAGGLPALACADQSGTLRYALAWTRPSPGKLVLERRQLQPAPAVLRPVAELAVHRKVWISAPPQPSCGGAP
jgi:hypothetical protein